MTQTRLVITADQINAYSSNKLIGYADRDGNLFKIDGKGNAVECGTINHRSEIIAKLTASDVR